MSRILISVFLAVALAGGILWTPWQQVQANRTYLQAVVISSTAGSLEYSELVEPEPEYFNKTYTPPTVAEEKEAEEVAEQVIDEQEEVAEELVAVTEVTLPQTDQEVVPEVVPEEVLQVTKKITKPKIIAPKDPLAAEVLRLLNLERADQGYGPLVLDQELSAVAKAHSKDMATKDYLAHQDKNGCNLTCRITDAGYTALAWAENIIYLENEYLLSTKEEAKEMMESWMGSGGHRKNIENGEYTHVGIGVARSGDKVYVTTDFALPK